jgi:hypothetical protein
MEEVRRRAHVDLLRKSSLRLLANVGVSRALD